MGTSLAERIKNVILIMVGPILLSLQEFGLIIPPDLGDTINLLINLLWQLLGGLFTVIVSIPRAIEHFKVFGRK